MTNDEVYAPFLDAFKRVSQKRPIHKVTCDFGSYDQRNQHHFLTAKIIPHRSDKFRLELVFTASKTRDSKAVVVRVNVTTHTHFNESLPGAIGDAMALMADVVSAWTIIAEQPTP